MYDVYNYSLFTSVSTPCIQNRINAMEPNRDTFSPVCVRIGHGHQGQVTTHKVRVICRFLDEHLHKIARSHFFLNPIFAGSIYTSQLLLNQVQCSLCKHTQINLVPVMDMPPIC
jgi:hypothetical protein